jgi:hypothetical protein
MAGSSTISTGSTTTTSHISPTYRVTIDIPRIQANVFAMEGGRLSDLAVRNWLRSVGFAPQPDGRTWIADAETVRRLDKSEIVRAERV